MIDFDYETSKAQLEASGWKLKNFAQENLFNSHIFYLVDYRNDSKVLLSIPLGTFDKYQPTSGSISSATAAICELLDPKLNTFQPNIATDDALGIALLDYLKKNTNLLNVEV